MKEPRTPEEEQIIQGVFGQKSMLGQIKPVAYAYSMCVNMPDHQVDADVSLQEKYDLSLTLSMITPDDFLLQIDIEGVWDTLWLRGTMDQMTTWLEELEASPYDGDLWYKIRQ